MASGVPLTGFVPLASGVPLASAVPLASSVPLARGVPLVSAVPLAWDVPLVSAAPLVSVVTSMVGVNVNLERLRQCTQPVGLAQRDASRTFIIWSMTAYMFVAGVLLALLMHGKTG